MSLPKTNKYMKGQIYRSKVLNSINYKKHKNFKNSLGKNERKCQCTHVKIMWCTFTCNICQLSNPANALISPLPKTLDPNCPKLVFRPQTQNFRSLWSGNFFVSSSIKFGIKIFSNWIIMSVHSHRIAKNPFKRVLFSAISDM